MLLYATFNQVYLSKTKNIFRIDIICQIFNFFLLNRSIFFQKANISDFISENTLQSTYQRTIRL